MLVSLWLVPVHNGKQEVFQISTIHLRANLIPLSYLIHQGACEYLSVTIT